MDELDTAKRLISAGKYGEASRVLNKLLKKNRENDQLWYFLGLLALKMKNYDLTEQYLDEAISIRTKPEYFWLKGMAYLELLEVEAAIETFRKLLEMDEKNADANFFLSICYLLLDDPRSEKFLKRAYIINKKRTKQLLRNFFETFVKQDTTESLAAKIKAEIDEA
jgi:tetratricopeptide (TPR) repeat protein